MDPNEALKRCREAARAARNQYGDHDEVVDRDRFEAAAGDALACFEALDAWLVRGGFLPRDWQKAGKP